MIEKGTESKKRRGKGRETKTRDGRVIGPERLAETEAGAGREGKGLRDRLEVAVGSL